MGGITGGLFSRAKAKVDNRTAEIQAQREKAAAAAAANAEVATAARRKRAQGGLLTSGESSTVLSSAGKSKNTTANATVLGSGGK